MSHDDNCKNSCHIHVSCAVWVKTSGLKLAKPSVPPQSQLFLSLLLDRYRDVGKPIMISHILGILVRILLILIPILVRFIKMRRRTKALTQAQMNAAYVVCGREWWLFLVGKL